MNQTIASIEPSLSLKITSLAKKLKAEGRSICSFAAGEPDFDTPEHIKQAAVAAIEAGETKYAPSSGLPELRNAIVEKFRADNGLEYSAEQIVVSNGAKHSLFNVFMALCDAGDEVIVPAPYWLSYPEMVKIAGGKPVIVKCRREDDYKLMPEDLEAAITDRTRVLIVNSPSNPTGVVYSEAELRALTETALKHGLYIVSDEIYEKLVYDGARHVSVAALSDEALARTITVNGFSKSFSMTGWRLGYFAGPMSVVKPVAALQSHSTSGPNTFAMHGAVAALKAGYDCVEEMRQAFDERRSVIYERLTAMPGVECVKPSGAFYVMPDISSFGMDSLRFSEELLNAHGVAVVPGGAFGAPETIRLSYACSMDNICEGMDRLAAFVGSL